MDGLVRPPIRRLGHNGLAGRAHALVSVRSADHGIYSRDRI